MKRIILLIFIVIVIIGLLITPFVNGYFFKKTYYKQMALYQTLYQEQAPQNLEFRVDSYQLGWLQSKADVSVTLSLDKQTAARNYPMPPLVFHIQSIIHHGPLIYSNNKLHLANAYIETFVNLPDFLKAFIPQDKKGFMQVNTEVTSGGHKWDNQFVIPAISKQQFGTWGGVSGNLMLDTSNDQLQIKERTTYGALHIPFIMPSLPEIQIQPIEESTEATRETSSIWNGVTDIKSAGLILKWQEGRTFSLNNFDFNIVYQRVNNNLFTYNSKISVDSLDAASLLPVADIPKFVQTLAINNLSIDGILFFSRQQYTFSRENYNDSLGHLLKLLSPTTNADMNINFNTEIGAASASLKLSLKALPKTENEINENLKTVFNMRMAQALTNKLIVSYLESQPNMPSPTSLQNSAKTIMNNMVQQGYVKQDKNDYVLEFSRDGLKNTLNGKVMSDDDLMKAGINIQQSFMSVSTPPTPNPVMSPGMSPIGNPVMTPTVRPMMNQNMNSTVHPALTPTVSPMINPAMHPTAANPAMTTPTVVSPIVVNPGMNPAMKNPPMSSSPPSIAKPSVSPSMSPGVHPAVNQSSYHCYWMDNTSGKNVWVATPISNKQTCFELDSCNGGMGQSRGGCYKWAASPDVQPENWHTN